MKIYYKDFCDNFSLEVIIKFNKYISCHPVVENSLPLLILDGGAEAYRISSYTEPCEKFYNAIGRIEILSNRKQVEIEIEYAKQIILEEGAYFIATDDYECRIEVDELSRIVQYQIIFLKD